LITWNEHEAQYSQVKIKLYRLFRTLKAAKVWLVGVKNLTIEVDAKYICGMINNPDIQPNAAINCWITRISLFDFKLKHIPGTKHAGPDGLSRRPQAPEDESDEDSTDVEDWIDEILSCVLWVAKELDGECLGKMSCAQVLHSAGEAHNSDLDIPSNNASQLHDRELQDIQTYLKSLTVPIHTPEMYHVHLLKWANQFFLSGEHLWHKDPAGPH
jgi:hypothetical protein